MASQPASLARSTSPRVRTTSTAKSSNSPPMNVQGDWPFSDKAAAQKNFHPPTCFSPYSSVRYAHAFNESTHSSADCLLGVIRPGREEGQEGTKSVRAPDEFEVIEARQSPG